MKLHKIGVRPSILSIMVGLVALSSCTKEPIEGPVPADGDRMEVRVTFPQSEVTSSTTKGTDVGTPDENRLGHITIFIFNEDGSKLETVFPIDLTSANTSLPTSQPRWETEKILSVNPLISPLKPKKIYAVANWTQPEIDKDTYTETMLKEETKTIKFVAYINDDKAYPMLMSGSTSVQSLASASYSATVDLERQVSKIITSLTISQAVQSKLPNIEWNTDLMTVRVANIPNKSYIIGRQTSSPADLSRLDYGPISVDDTLPPSTNQAVPISTDLKLVENIYINENIVMGTSQQSKDLATYLVIRLPYKNRITQNTTIDNCYLLYLNDTRDAASPYRILRNTIYNLNIDILGLGLPEASLTSNVNIHERLTVNTGKSGEVHDAQSPQ